MADQGLFPLLEHNQGLFSFGALALALLALLAQSRFAHDAEQQMRNAARRQEVIDRQRALEMEVKEEKDRKELRHQEIRDFASTVVNLIMDADKVLGDCLGATAQTQVWEPPPAVKEQLAATEQVLRAMFQAPPRDPEMILLTARSALIIGMISRLERGRGLESNQLLGAARKSLESYVAQISKRHDDMLEA